MKKYKIHQLWLIILFLAAISCGNENFPTPEAATVQTKSVTEITGSTATSGGQIVLMGGNDVSTRGICWGTEENPTLSETFVKDTLNSNDFTSQISGLMGGTTYYVRAYATNNGGIAFGENMSFTTKVVPYLTTNVVTAITGTSATCGGVITNSFGAQIVSRGVCWSTSVNPSTDDSKTIDGGGTDPFTSAIINLSPSTTYHVRSYATTSEGETGYGNDVIFDTQITDYDGNVYTSVKIGQQVWMVESFKCTHFNNGSDIAYYYYGSDPANKEYGANYSWNDIVKQNFAPNGWRVPTDVEWRALYEFVGTNGLKLKEKGTNHWDTANGTNETGFTAFGSAHIYGVPLKGSATWWTSSENSATDGLRWYMFDDGTIGRTANDKSMFFTVRLVKAK
jgi:uncharacterized protein (TIGR02145 family)